MKFSTYYCRKKMKILTNFQIGISVPLGYCRGWGRVVAALWWALVLGVGVPYCLAHIVLRLRRSGWFHSCGFGTAALLMHSAGFAVLAHGSRWRGALGMPRNVNLRKMWDVKTTCSCFQVILYVASIFLLVAHVSFTYFKVLVFKSDSVYLKIFLVEANFFFAFLVVV